MAAGFSVSAEKVEALRRGLIDTCNRLQNGKVQSPILDIDLVVDESDVTIDLARLFVKLAPFGIGNKKPLLCLPGATCQSTRLLGKEGKHHRIMLKSSTGGSAFECVIWNIFGNVPAQDEEVDVVFTPEINAFNGRERLQLVVADWRLSGRGEEPDVLENEAAHTSQPLQIVAGSGSALEQQPVSVLNSKMAEIPIDGLVRSLQSTASAQKTWKDLRDYSDGQAIISSALEKLGDKLSVFAEGAPRGWAFSTVDRSNLAAAQHLIIWQFPPALKIFQEVLSRSQASNIYLLGSTAGEFLDVPSFVKQLFGIIRFAVSKRDGKIAGDKMAAALATTKMAVALGLSMLRKLNVIDWYADEGDIYLDLIGSPTGAMDEMAEFRQLSDVLCQIDSFRKWCATAKLKEIQLATMPNQIELASTIPNELAINGSENLVSRTEGANEQEDIA
jgi:hypothetical protein